MGEHEIVHSCGIWNINQGYQGIDLESDIDLFQAEFKNDMFSFKITMKLFKVGKSLKVQRKGGGINEYVYKKIYNLCCKNLQKTISPV